MGHAIGVDWSMGSVHVTGDISLVSLEGASMIRTWSVHDQYMYAKEGTTRHNRMYTQYGITGSTPKYKTSNLAFLQDWIDFISNLVTCWVVQLRVFYFVFEKSSDSAIYLDDNKFKSKGRVIFELFL